MNDPLRILGIAGSLRRESYNRALLRAAQRLAPEGTALDSFDLEGIPLFNQDHEHALPERVAAFKADIRAADAILFVTPEYNYSLPGVLKNAIDWASRPSGDSAWRGKPAAILGASPGTLGTARAQYHLRQILVTLNMPTLNQPEVMVGSAADKFDAQGGLTDADTRERVGQLLRALAELARRYGQ